MSEKTYLLSLVDAYEKAGDIENMKILRGTLDSYDLTPVERDEIDALLAKFLSQPASHESPPTEEVSHSDHEAKIAEILVTLQTNPDGLADALEEGISPGFKARFADLIAARLERRGLIESIDWGKNVSDYLERCEKQGGVPMYRCYSEDTEVLTDDGWKYFNEVTTSDLVYTLNPKGIIELQSPREIIWVPYQGDMYQIQNSQLDLLVTPNHAMYVAKVIHRRKGKKRWNEKARYKLAIAEEIFGKKVCYKKDGIWEGVHRDYFTEIGRYIRMDEWLKFFGFWLAEGYTSIEKRQNGSYDCITVITNTNKKLLDEFASLVRSWGINAGFGNRHTQLVIHDKKLFKYLHKFGKAWEKYVPKEIKVLDKDLLTVFFNYYMKGDGSENSYNHSLSAATTSKRLRGDLQEIALKIGLSANYSFDKRKKFSFIKEGDRERLIIRRHPCWRINFVKHRNEVMIRQGARRATEKWVDYNGYVGCVEVPKYHVIYVRRNGKPVWCGNTRYASKRFEDREHPGKYLVLFICYGKKWSQWFNAVPIEDIEHLEAE